MTAATRLTRHRRTASERSQRPPISRRGIAIAHCSQPLPPPAVQPTVARE
ncbi:MAG: hypothetical protein ACFB0G_00905 [Leptolyngbyaceae cyanobacterium]